MARPVKSPGKTPRRTSDKTVSNKTVDVADSYAVRLMQHLVVPTFVIDPRRRVVIWNRACERLTGVAASEVIGTSKHWQAFYETRRPCLADLVALDRPERLPEFYSEYAARGHNGLGFSAENWCTMPKLGNQLYLAIDAGPIHDEAGHLIAVVETLRDLTDQKRAEMALKELAAKDGLTGLSNRRSFDQMLMSEWARAHRTQDANRGEARERLAELVGKAHMAPAKRKKTKPSKAAKAKRVDAKKERSAVKAGRGKVRLD